VRGAPVLEHAETLMSRDWVAPLAHLFTPVTYALPLWSLLTVEVQDHHATTLGWALTGALAATGAVTMTAAWRHQDRYCRRCAPDTSGEARRDARRQAWKLRLFHRSPTLITAIAITPVVLGFWTFYGVVVVALATALMHWVYEAHTRLYPWCPLCAARQPW
jgi:hypothetical protein